MSFYINVLDRIKKVKNFSKDTELAEYLGETKQNIGNWYARAKYNIDDVLDICKRDNLDVNYILTGDKEPDTNIELIKLQAKYEELDKRYNELEEKTRGNQPRVSAESPQSERKRVG